MKNFKLLVMALASCALLAACAGKKKTDAKSADYDFDKELNTSYIGEDDAVKEDPAAPAAPAVKEKSLDGKKKTKKKAPSEKAQKSAP